MKNENEKEMSDKEIVKDTLDLMGEVLCLLYETKDAKLHAAAFMADSLTKYLTAYFHDKDILLAAADYNEIEEEIYNEKKNKENYKEVVPYSLEAERAVIGSIMLKSSNIEKVVDIIDESDFYNNDLSMIFVTMKYLHEHGEPIDPIIIAEDLKHNPNIERILYEAGLEVPDQKHIVSYAQIVREKSVLRNLLKNYSENPNKHIAEKLLNKVKGEIITLADEESKNDNT